MKFFNALLGYFLYFFAPRKLIYQSFRGTLLQLGVRLPDVVVKEISSNIFDIYNKNKMINNVTKKGGVVVNMETMYSLIQYEAIYIRDLLSHQYTYTTHDGHKKTIEILDKYNISLPNFHS